MSIIRSKKGLSVFMVLIGAVMLGVIVIILIILFKQMADASEAEAMNTRCRSSLMAYSRLKSVPLGSSTADASTIKCPTKYVTIESGTDQNMRREIANLMTECWQNMGEGKLKLFSPQDQKFCMICSVYEFENAKTKLEGLPSFLMTEKAPVKVQDKRPTYYEYFTGDPAKETNITAAKGSIDLSYIDGSSRYAVVFVYSTESYWTKLKKSSTLMAVGVAIGSPLTAYAMTKMSGGTGTNLITAKYDVEGLKELGCDALPVSQMDERFR